MPVERWSLPQVEALAPDAASVKAARALTFSASGRVDDLLWGLCRGYQVAVDLAGPAFRCSCPSRKVPCKHALGLLMLWAESDVSAAPAPSWVLDWQAARAESRPRTAGRPAIPGRAGRASSAGRGRPARSRSG